MTKWSMIFSPLRRKTRSISLYLKRIARMPCMSLKTRLFLCIFIAATFRFTKKPVRNPHPNDQGRSQVSACAFIEIAVKLFRLCQALRSCPRLVTQFMAQLCATFNWFLTLTVGIFADNLSYLTHNGAIFDWKCLETRANVILKNISARNGHMTNCPRLNKVYSHTEVLRCVICSWKKGV